MPNFGWNHLHFSCTRVPSRAFQFLHVLFSIYTCLHCHLCRKPPSEGYSFKLLDSTVPQKQTSEVLYDFQHGQKVRFNYSLCKTYPTTWRGYYPHSWGQLVSSLSPITHFLFLLHSTLNKFRDRYWENHLDVLKSGHVSIST